MKGQFWLNTSTTPNPLEYYDGANWTIVGWLDPTNHQWIANQAGGTGTIASAGTTDLGTVLNQVVTITCTTTITALGTTALAGAQYDLDLFRRADADPQRHLADPAQQRLEYRHVGGRQLPGDRARLRQLEDHQLSDRRRHAIAIHRLGDGAKPGRIGAGAERAAEICASMPPSPPMR